VWNSFQFFDLSGPWTTIAWNDLQKYQEVFVCSPTNPDLANILGRTDCDFDNFHFVIFVDPKFPDFQVPRFPASHISKFLGFQTSRRCRRTNSQIPTWPLSQRTQGSNTSQGALAAIMGNDDLISVDSKPIIGRFQASDALSGSKGWSVCCSLLLHACVACLPLALRQSSIAVHHIVASPSMAQAGSKVRRQHGNTHPTEVHGSWEKKEKRERGAKRKGESGTPFPPL